MRDPHVVSLRYRLVLLDEDTEYRDPPPLDLERGLFSLHLEDNVATVTMQSHFASEEEARAALDPHLRDWELHVALGRGRPAIRFSFESADVIDRNPPPPGGDQIVSVGTGVLQMTALAPAVHVTCNRYPEPPTRFKASPDVETMWFRYEGYRARKEPLAAMGYFCLTVIKSRGGRKLAAKVLNIDNEVLGKLGELTSAVGDSRSGRKFSEASRPHTLNEKGWIDAAVRALIRRVGEYDSNPKAALPRTLSMRELPSL